MDLGFSTLNSGNWTFECWAIIEAGDLLAGKFNGGNKLEGFGVSNTTGYMYTHTAAVVETPTCNTDLRDGKWHYLVWERYNGTYYYWADGSLETSFANTETPSGGGNWSLGGWSNAQMTGNIKEARLSLTTAVYSGSAPTTPTEPQTAAKSTDAFFTGVGLEVKDYSSNNRTFTVPAALEVQATAPYDYNQYSSATNGGSIYHDGTGGDYIKTDTSADFAFGSNDFTVECWYYPVSKAQNYPRILHFGEYWSNSRSWGLLDRHNSINTKFTVQSFALGTILESTTTVSNNQWYHLAVVRSGGTITLYVNGAAEDTYNISTNNYPDASSTSYLSLLNVSDGANLNEGQANGSLTDVRVIQGTAVYASAFTPPTAPLTEITNTSLLLKGTNAGIIDKSQTAKTLTLTGDVQSSTAQTKYSTTSIKFDGTGDKIEVPDFQLLRDGRDFTIEFWIYLTNTGAERNILETFSFGATSGWTIYHLSGGRLDFYPSHTNLTTLSATTWTHIAIENYGGTIKCFVNGTSTYSTTHTNTSTPSAGLRIGTRSGTSNYFNGYMEDLRITDGYARYQGTNFTPPTAALKG